MGQVGTIAAGRRAGRGTSWVGKAAVAASSLALVAAFAAWTVDFSPAALTNGPSLSNAAASLSFDDRFASRSPLTTGSVYSPLRRDFNAEFGHIEGALGWQLREGQVGTPMPASPPQSRGPSVAGGVPLPRSRPVEANASMRTDLPPPVQEVAKSEDRSLLQKFVDLMPGKIRLASLDPSGGIIPGPGPDLTALGYDSTTAVYDITAKVVYLPDGIKLEAHSGLGNMLDDPARVDARNVGPTPPGTYDMKPREALFHGVPALRMNPVEGTDTFGRVGLLVHSYMLGPNGDSNGCVSVKNYDRFLRAYRNGDIKRIVVVIGLNKAPQMVAQSRTQS